MASTSDAPPLWVYPNLLGLDAPVVAVVWQGFLARAFGVPLPPAAVVGLFSVVWCVYLADRLLDAKRVEHLTTDRHCFAARHRRPLSVLAVIALVVTVLAAVLVPPSFLLTGAGVAVAVGGYLLAVHLIRPAWLRGGGKELLVGVVFGAGVAVPLAVAGEPSAWGPGVVGFALCCWWNCRLIDRWEVRPAAGRAVGRVIGTAAVVTGWFSPWPVRVAVAAAAGLLLAVDLAVPRIGPRAGRVLADAVLLTPLCVWAFAP